MKLKEIFYLLKPLIPRSFQIYVRRKMIKKQLIKYKHVWPILSSSEKLPENWSGWPKGKKFAFILTHDVELQGGHDKSLQLAMIEKESGFVSSYNFVPERYNVSPELRQKLVNLGFEVGIHGLNHDGKLFSNRKIFNERAERINYYIKQWNAVGFRAPAMHHNLGWIQDLNIEYDLSTFDTDPFEPQPDGMKTIFPFIVKDEEREKKYVEMPYTLPQDFTLLILMKEDISIWKNKLDWIAEKGGMALVNVHPDYINFMNEKTLEEFPIKYYIEFLKYVKLKYENKYWNVLPKEAAKFWMEIQFQKS
jgi:peptidoglycan/xylan/chitin deacetylase (PgdA/CDA1 family)